MLCGYSQCIRKASQLNCPLKYRVHDEWRVHGVSANVRARACIQLNVDRTRARTRTRAHTRTRIDSRAHFLALEREQNTLTCLVHVGYESLVLACQVSCDLYCTLCTSLAVCELIFLSYPHSAFYNLIGARKFLSGDTPDVHDSPDPFM